MLCSSLKRRVLLALATPLVLVAACAPSLPKGVDKDRLEAAVSQAIGGPNTCVLIGDATSGRLVYRYNSHAACALKLPACDAPQLRNAGDLLHEISRTGRTVRLSCNSVADGSRGAGWAAGPIPGRPLVYAASMEGDRAFPGLMMADRLERAFKHAGL